ELSWDEARQLGHNYIGTEHLLLGLIREGEGVAIKVLEEFKVNLKDLRIETIQRTVEASKSNPQPTEQQSSPSPQTTINPDFCCPNCAERIPKDAITCRHCGYGISDEHFVECKFCKERIRRGAIKCRFCQTDFGDSQQEPSQV